MAVSSDSDVMVLEDEELPSEAMLLSMLELCLGELKEGVLQLEGGPEPALSWLNRASLRKPLLSSSPCR